MNDPADSSISAPISWGSPSDVAGALDRLLRDTLEGLTAAEHLSPQAATELHRRVMLQLERLPAPPSAAAAWSAAAREALWNDLADGRIPAKVAARIDRALAKRLDPGRSQDAWVR